MGLSAPATLIGTSSLVAQTRLGKSVRAISAKEGKMGGLEGEGPAAAELNQPKGIGRFAFPAIPVLGAVKFFPG